MKAIFKIMMIIFTVIVFLSACGSVSSEEPVTEPPADENPEVPEEEKIEIIDKTAYRGENGKLGFHKNGVPVTEPIFDEINLCEEKFDEKKVYEGKYTDGKRIQFVPDSVNGPYLEEVPNVLYYLMDEDGNLMNEKPLENYYFLMPYGFGNATYDWFLDGTYAGDRYKYSAEKDGTYDLHTKESAGACSVLGNRANGKEYIETVYIWNLAQIKYGLTDLDGNVILEDIYARISTPYDDRIYAYVGWGFQSADEIRLEIYDFEGNLINNSYNHIEQHNSEDGYFLVGYCFGENAYEICRDENGNPHEEGYWFVDESGNKLSERYERIYVEKYMTQDGGMWKIGKITVTDENGNEKEISAEPYKRYYE